MKELDFARCDCSDRPRGVGEGVKKTVPKIRELAWHYQVGCSVFLLNIIPQTRMDQDKKTTL